MRRRGKEEEQNIEAGRRENAVWKENKEMREDVIEEKVKNKALI